MQSEVINRLRSAIEYVEADKAQDCAHAETTGERVDLNDYDVSLSLEDAKAIEAALSAQAQDVAGWKLVPIDPSAGMIAAAKSTTSAALTRSHTTEIYRAMLAAAPAKHEGGTNE